MECDYREAIGRLGLLALLATHDPRIAGTLPLGIARPDSDVDVLCHAPDAGAFADLVWSTLGSQADFSIRQWVGDGRPVVAGFRAYGWTFELFGHPSPVNDQRGWRHFEVERRLLDLGGEPLRRAVLDRRLQGAKTEPAFAAVLGLPGDPYIALLDLAASDDRTLKRLLTASGFEVTSSARPD